MSGGGVSGGGVSGGSVSGGGVSGGGVSAVVAPIEEPDEVRRARVDLDTLIVESAAREKLKQSILLQIDDAKGQVKDIEKVSTWIYGRINNKPLVYLYSR